MQFIFEQIDTAGDRNFGYLIGDRKAKEAVIIDPSFRPEFIIRRAEAQELRVLFILNTHGHYDHTFGNTIAKRLTGAEIIAWHESDTQKDIGIRDLTQITLGDYTIQALHTPGHSEDHLVYFIPQYNVLLTGDHLFVGKIGGTKDKESTKKQYESFQKMLHLLPHEATVWPGHDYGCRPSSTLYLESKTNPFLMARSFEEFFEVKDAWKAIKLRNGLV